MPHPLQYQRLEIRLVVSHEDFVRPSHLRPSHIAHLADRESDSLAMLRRRRIQAGTPKSVVTVADSAGALADPLAPCGLFDDEAIWSLQLRRRRDATDRHPARQSRNASAAVFVRLRAIDQRRRTVPEGLRPFPAGDARPRQFSNRRCLRAFAYSSVSTPRASLALHGKPGPRSPIVALRRHAVWTGATKSCEPVSTMAERLTGRCRTGLESWGAS